MDNEANLVNQAAAVLQQQLGRQVAGPKERGMGQMMRVLGQQLRLDDATADRVVKKLNDTGRLRYVETGKSDELSGTTPTAPVASLPGVYQSSGSGELIVPSGQGLETAAVLGSIPTAGGNVSGAMPEAATDESATAVGDQNDAGQLVDSADQSWRKTENREGASMGQLGDTNAEGGVPRPVTVGERQEGTATNDTSEGYWLVG